MKLDTLNPSEVQSARTVTLLQVITEVFPFLIFAIVSLFRAYISKSVEDK